MNARTRHIHFVSVALALWAALPACAEPAEARAGHGAPRSPAAAVPVKAEVVDIQRADTRTRYAGSLEPAVRVDVAFRVGGYVEALGLHSGPDGKRPLDKGDFVEKGAVLARVRAADYAQRVALSEAQIAEARAAAKLADEELARTRRLFEAAAVTRAELDQRLARADSAHAQLAAAFAREGEAGLSLSDTVLRAPIDGIVLDRSVEVGSLVAPGQPVMAIADTRTVKAVFGAPQSLVEQLRLGSAVRVFVFAAGEGGAQETAIEASVTRIAPAADGNGRVFSVEAALPNPDGALRPGAVVSVHVPMAQGEPSPSVPLAAVVRSPRNARGFAVFVLPGSSGRARAQLRDVELGELTGNAVTVTRGLTRGERVVTLGAGLLQDGDDAVVIR